VFQVGGRRQGRGGESWVLGFLVADELDEAERRSYPNLISSCLSHLASPWRGHS
jgi:hypothetical protein